MPTSKEVAEAGVDLWIEKAKENGVQLSAILEMLQQTYSFSSADAAVYFSGKQGEAAAKYVDYARENMIDEGNIEVDETALVSLSSDRGAYVQAWLWVDQAAAGVTEYEQEQEM